MTEDEMVGWQHQFYGHEFEQALGVGDGQGSLEWYSSWNTRANQQPACVHSWIFTIN